MVDEDGETQTEKEEEVNEDSGEEKMIDEDGGKE